MTRVARPAEVQDAAFQAGGEAGKDDPRKQRQPGTQRTESSVRLENSEVSGRQASQDLRAVVRSLGCTVKAAEG